MNDILNDISALQISLIRVSWCTYCYFKVWEVQKCTMHGSSILAVNYMAMVVLMTNLIRLYPSSKLDTHIAKPAVEDNIIEWYYYLVADEDLTRRKASWPEYERYLISVVQETFGRAAALQLPDLWEGIERAQLVLSSFANLCWAAQKRLQASICELVLWDCPAATGVRALNTVLPGKILG